MSSSIEQFFSADGPLAAAIPGYRVRNEQTEMAGRIAGALKENRVLVAEAGTGTGKTFAYLVPALLSGGKVIISTGTKTLQDQLFGRDLPTVRAALKAPVKIALLKGRANYVCHYHLERAQNEGRFLTREDAAHVRRISRFLKETRSGDKAECSGVPEASPVWYAVTSTRENCLGQECAYHKDCFVLAARREALSADIVVVNHHLFFADVMLRDEGVAELLPACNAVIFDEAHQLPETASLFFGDSFSTTQLLDLSRDTQLEALEAARDCLDLPPLCRGVEKAARDFRLTLPLEPARYAQGALIGRPGFVDALMQLQAELQKLLDLLETQAERSEGLENCRQRTLLVLEQLQQWHGTGSGSNTIQPADSANSEYVRWGETYSQSLQLNRTPLSIAGIFQKQMGGHPRAWIFTSATLAVGKDFSHYCGELGLDSAESAYWASPFNYPHQALLYAPTGLPEPNGYGYTEAVVEAAWPAIRACGGRTFMLCTSLKAMRRTHELLQARLEDEKIGLPLLLQGEAGKTELLDRFRQLGNAILVASQSFWEGVDVRGEALSLVVIDRIPFAPPDDPVLAARIEQMNRMGRNPFMEYQLPRAVINVKQGAGRLIRDETDRGVLMICDPRLTGKNYGRRIWQSLPPMRRTRALDEVLAFFQPS